jgi:hypothetical protein
MITQRPSRFPFFGQILLVSTKLTLFKAFALDGVVPNPATSTGLKVNISTVSLYCRSFGSRLNFDWDHWHGPPCILRARDVAWSLNFGVESFKLVNLDIAEYRSSTRLGMEMGSSKQIDLCPGKKLWLNKNIELGPFPF